VLLSGSELARRAAAEMIGATNTAGEGHEVLREAAADENAGARRAAVYGLDRIGEPWAQDLIVEMERGDAAWMVRTSASLVMEKVRSGDLSAAAPQELLRPESTPWLIKWLDDRNESIAPGVQGIGQLVRALQEGDEATRLAAVEMLGALAIYDATRPLYAALRDPHHEIRDAAQRALCSISLATNHALPGVM
jgi:HEAT repeat protein